MGLLNIQSPMPGLHLRRQAPPVPATRGFVTVRRTGALGDALAATVVVKKLQNLGFEVIFQAGSPCHCILRRVPVIRHLAEPNGVAPTIDLDGAYEQNPNKRTLHFAEMFVNAANEQLRGMAAIADARNFAPRMVLTDADVEKALKVFERYPKPWVVICPRSNSWPQRTVPDDIWCNAAAQMEGTKFWLGTHPCRCDAYIVDLRCRHFDDVIAFVGIADLLVTVDTGVMHVAAAIGTPCVVVQQACASDQHLSDNRDWVGVSPALDCLNCRELECPIDPESPPCQDVPANLISSAVNARLQCVTQNGVSAVIVIHRPTAERLNRCLTCALPQADEVVIVSDTAGQVPDGLIQDTKIKFVKMQGDLGYGRKANRAARETNHRWLAFINDDVFLEPDAIEQMCRCAHADVGAIGMELRYPTGLIQHAGKHRPMGHRGWGHTDWNQQVSRYTEPVEMENICGASMLVRREAFFQASGWDEDLWLYGDDDLAIFKIRQAGWKVIYTPHAKGTHIEHASSCELPNIGEQCAKSDVIMRRKLAWWFELNKNSTGLGVFE
jgi:GT2 family glycosyltransferase/ADP-heptose:LPS heptosyltransferase